METTHKIDDYYEKYYREYNEKECPYCEVLPLLTAITKRTGRSVPVDVFQK